MKNKEIVKYFLLLFLFVPPRVAAADSPVSALSADKAPSTSSRSDRQKILIGAVEDVVLLPWAITLPARIDTGAAVSSLDARDVSVRNNVAEFRLGEQQGNLRLQLPVVDWTRIRTSVGSEKRPVVEIGICLGPKLIRTLATLKDRSNMSYPFLVGRNVLNASFVVDTSRTKAVSPECSSRTRAQASRDASFNRESRLSNADAF